MPNYGANCAWLRSTRAPWPSRESDLAAYIERREAAPEYGGSGRRAKPLDEIPCTCGAGMNLTGHNPRCLRGKAIKRRGLAG